MALTQEFLDKVTLKLSQFGAIRTKKMFGGVGIYFEDLFFALISQDKLYFKVDDSTRQDYINFGMEPFQSFSENPMKGYYELPKEIFDNSIELKVWIENSVNIAKSKKKK